MSHAAAVLNEKGTPLRIEQRQTPKPGPDELLINVKSIALNPIDHAMRDFGFAVSHFPAVVGSDIAGTVVAVGSSVSNADFVQGARVAAFAPAFFKQGLPDYGALQKQVLVPYALAVPLPASVGDNEAATLPMSVLTTWSAMYTAGVPYTAAFKPEDKRAILVWGGASSIGTAGIQIGKSLGLTVYTTASPRNHEYLESLGASQCFNYKDSDVVSKIVAGAKKDGVTLNIGYNTAPTAAQQCVDVLKEFKPAVLANAIPPRQPYPQEAGVDVKFVMAPDDEKEQTEHFAFVFNKWLKEKLARGEYTPAPKVQIVSGGLESANQGLDELKAGVSGVKLVLEV